MKESFEYKQGLFDSLSSLSIRSILEIGVYRGDLASRMLQIVSDTKNTPISYYGVDLFELMNDEILEKEISLYPLKEKEVENKLKEKFPKINIELFKGYSKDVLPKINHIIEKVDLIYIDGGHSLETIKSDWDDIKDSISNDCIVFFDDYYDGRNDIGAKSVIDGISNDSWEIEYSKGKHYDTISGELLVRQVKVRRKNYFSPENEIEAKGLILEEIDNITRDWIGETNETIKIIKNYISKESIVCDIGCGIGRIAIPLSKHVASVIAVDNSKKMLLFLEESIKEKNLENIDAMLTNEWFGTSDLVNLFVAIYSFQHINKSTLDNIIQQIKKVGNQDSKLLIINTPTRFVADMEQYYDDDLNIKEYLKNNFTLCETIDLQEIGEIGKHHFGHIYSIHN